MRIIAGCSQFGPSDRIMFCVSELIGRQVEHSAVNHVIRFTVKSNNMEAPTTWWFSGLVSPAPASFHCCGRQYREVWRVAIETASAEDTQGPNWSTRWRCWFGEKSCFHEAAVEDLTS